MNTRIPRFEVVRTHAGFHARYIAANGKTVFTTEVYNRRRAALRAIALISESSDAPGRRWLRSTSVEVRDVDERGLS